MSGRIIIFDNNSLPDFIDNGTEYIEKIKLPGSKRILVFIFKNSKKYKISAELKYDLHV